LAAVGYFSYSSLVPQNRTAQQQQVPPRPAPETVPKPETAFQRTKPDLSKTRGVAEPLSSRPSAQKPPLEMALQDAEPEPPREFPKDINEIRKQLYNLGIEYTEDIELLDEIVQTDTDAREFWGGDWHSEDDFKAEEDGFELEQNADGTYTFTPDEVTARSYSFFEAPQSFSYDPDRNEFSWDVDYYGKIITNRFKFINEDTAVLMIISGRKVTTNLYKKNVPPDPEYVLPEME
jgi:hypothetical protein